MHPVDIKAAIKKAGTSQAAIAADLGVSPVTVHQVIHNTCHSRRIANHIADLLALTTDDLWPDTYKDKAA